MRFSLVGSLVLLLAAGACGGSGNDLFDNTGAAGSAAGGSGGAAGGQAGSGGAAGGGECEPACGQGDLRCEQDSVQTCVADALGCAIWSEPEACPIDKPFCSNGACAASCADECPASGSRACVGSGYRTCGQHDADPCLDWSAPASCGAGEACREPEATCVPGACVTGVTETRPCGQCGTQARVCGADSTWLAWGECTGEGLCAPGATDTIPCGTGGTQTRVCAATCAWGPYGECVTTAECAPGESAQEPCGNCGTRTRICSSLGTWGAWGPCANEGVCATGTQRTEPCNIVGVQTSSCDATCNWGPWGPCAGANPPPLDGGNGSFVFPRSGDASKPASSSTGFSMTSIGSYALGVRTTTLASATSLSSTIQYNNYLANSSTCHVTYDIYLNGTKIGSSGAGNQQPSSTVNLTFPAIAGPTYTVLYVTTASPTQSGCGALYLKKDVSNLVLK